jgi:hypothetical protein
MPLTRRCFSTWRKRSRSVTVKGVADPASGRQLRQILSRHRSFLTGSEQEGLVYHAGWVAVETVAVAIGADDSPKSHNRFTPLANLVLAGIGRNLLRLG